MQDRLVQIEIGSTLTHLSESVTESFGALAHLLKTPFFTQYNFTAEHNVSDESTCDSDESNNKAPDGD